MSCSGSLLSHDFVMSVDLISKLISDDQEDFKWHREKCGLDHWSLDYWTIFFNHFLDYQRWGEGKPSVHREGRNVDCYYSSRGGNWTIST